MTDLITSPDIRDRLQAPHRAAPQTPTPTDPVKRGPIVLALHGLESTTSHLRAAHGLAKRLGLGIEVVTVAETLGMPAELGMAPIPVPCQEFTPIQEEIVRRNVREVCGDEGWHLTVRYGSPAREIVRVADEMNSTMIVVAAAPHRGVRHQVSGVRAMQVLRRARCPVLSVAPDGGEALPRTIVAAIDFSPASIRAAEAGLLLLADGGTFILAHAPFPIPLPRAVQDHTGALLGAGVPDHFMRLRDELRPYLPPDATLQTRQLSGTVGKALLDLASDEHADLITIGRHSRNIVERFFVGSVATEVIHGATCSVLGSPEPTAAEVIRLKLRITESVSTSDASEWAAVLREASDRNAGRLVTLEEDDPALGAQVQASGFVLNGIDYDVVTRRVDVMLGRAGGATDHLTRSIDGVREIGIKADAGGRDQVIEIVHGRGMTLIQLGSRPSG